jgi:UDP-N-acetylglucosamine--N-acetylmuramyl-(pentapeptide) pyrophosphoryl-undecaprenol N-acetylglucosamine transferase
MGAAMTAGARATPAAAGPVVLAAGGTGGHLFPAEALARILVRAGHRVELVTDPRGGAFGRKLPQVTVHRIAARQVGGGLWRKALGAMALARGFWQARRLLKRLAPAVVVGFGGYPSLPTVRAAAAAGIPALLHEQNSRLGRANRWLAPHAQLICSSFPRLAGLPAAARGGPAGAGGTGVHVVLTGNPVRDAVMARAGAAYHPPGQSGPIRLLVFGGSQGAAVFSRVVPQALARLPAAVKRRLEVAQQCRPEDLDAVRAAYAASGVRVALAEFFADLPDRMSGSHLTIARAGASTIAELSVIGRPSILVPYPHAMDDHQRLNAERYSDAGGCWSILEAEFSPARLAEALGALIADPEALRTLAEAALAFGRPDAAEALAREVMRVGRLDGGAPAGGAGAASGGGPLRGRPAGTATPSHPVRHAREAV